MPKIIGDSLADHRQLTRQRLFDALGRLMAEQPFDSITMSQIAQDADVGRTAVYNHFPDKEALLLEYMRQTTTRFAEVLGDALVDEDDPLERLRIYVRAHLELRDRFHLASGVDLRLHVSAENIEHLHDHAGIVEHILYHILEAMMEQGQIPRQNSLALVGLIHSCLAGQYLPRDADEREDTIRLTQAFVLRAIGVDAREVPLPPSPTPALTARARASRHVGDRHDPQAVARCPVFRS